LGFVDRHRTAHVAGCVLAMVLALAAIMLGSTTSVADHGWQRGGARDRQRRATPAPPPVVTPIAGLTMTAQPLLGGWARAGDWAAVRVRLENEGPAVEGELRVASAASGSPSYAVAVHVPPGARQEHVLYGQPWVLRANLRITLERAGSVLAMREVSLTTSLDDDVLATFLVAERPERLLDEVRSSILLGHRRRPPVVPIGPGDLPPRVEAWAPMDRLVWQDVPFSGLGLDQLDALRTWVGLGGSLTLLGGSTGTTTLGDIPRDLLPYRPARVVDVATSDFAGLLGDLPADTGPVPAVAGDLLCGTALAAGGGDVIAARMPYGLGSVTMVGIDPATLTGTGVARRLWTRLLPSTDVRTAHRMTTYGRDIRRALVTLHAVSTPERDQVFALFLGYALLLGPVNYLVLRRMDRREWAWLTVPALVVAFTLVAYVLGVALKGTSVVVNELAIVHGAAGADRGIAQAWVAVYTPTRAAVDARVGGGALVTEAEEPGDRPVSERPLDVLHGDPSTVHAFEIGHGGVRAFAAQASVSVPRLDAELVLTGDRLQGTVRNLSDVPLEDVAVVYGRGARRSERCRGSRDTQNPFRDDPLPVALGLLGRLPSRAGRGRVGRGHCRLACRRSARGRRGPGCSPPRPDHVRAARPHRSGRIGDLHGPGNGPIDRRCPRDRLERRSCQSGRRPGHDDGRVPPGRFRRHAAGDPPDRPAGRSSGGRRARRTRADASADG
jgi:hypothetical protein